MTTTHTTDHSQPVDTYVSQPAVMQAISSPMVAALEQAWSDIRARHDDVPPAVVVLAAGSIGAPAGTLRLGHFAATRWTRDTNPDERLAEVFIGGEGLARGPADVLGTLLHEAAHAISHVRGIKDTSRQGRWHNTRFKALAEEVGIEVTKDPRLGWSPTTITDAILEDYMNTLTELRRALQMHRSPEAIRGGRKTSYCELYVRRFRPGLTRPAIGPPGCPGVDPSARAESDAQTTGPADRDLIGAWPFGLVAVVSVRSAGGDHYPPGQGGEGHHQHARA